MVPLIKMDLPDLMVFENFLSPAECDELIACATQQLRPAKVVSDTSIETITHSARTNSSTFLKRGQTRIIADIERRISELTNTPVENGESLQVLCYEVGQEYKQHHDYFRPSREVTPLHLKRGGQRIATFLMYLNTPESGGETRFPDVGVSIRARQGNALLFRYPTPTPDTKTLHAGTPVTKGVKWAATKWIRESKFT